MSFSSLSPSGVYMPPGRTRQHPSTTSTFIRSAPSSTAPPSLGEQVFPTLISTTTTVTPTTVTPTTVTPTTTTISNPWVQAMTRSAPRIETPPLSDELPPGFVQLPEIGCSSKTLSPFDPADMARAAFVMEQRHEAYKNEYNEVYGPYAYEHAFYPPTTPDHLLVSDDEETDDDEY